jgi:dipeptidyl aminopeptidase/acylaminoacyl peptidase
MSYRYFNSILDIKPFSAYKSINIPVLFIQGEMDVNVPVESTRYVEANLPEKPFSYIYYNDMAHSPRKRSQYAKLRSDIAQWINTR